MRVIKDSGTTKSARFCLSQKNFHLQSTYLAKKTVTIDISDIEEIRTTLQMVIFVLFSKISLSYCRILHIIVCGYILHNI